jgi:plasmid stabilization system protein ParE
VSSAEEFYENADEHFAWAETAKTERERAIFLQMAAAWLEVAQRWETSVRTARQLGGNRDLGQQQSWIKPERARCSRWSRATVRPAPFGYRAH